MSSEFLVLSAESGAEWRRIASIMRAEHVGWQRATEILRDRQKQEQKVTADCADNTDGGKQPAEKEADDSSAVRTQAELPFGL